MLRFNLSQGSSLIFLSEDVSACCFKSTWQGLRPAVFCVGTNPKLRFLWLSKWCKIQHFKILLIFNIYSFIFNICIYSALIFVQNSTPIFIFNISFCSQNYCPFRNYLSTIQQLFIRSRFTAHISYAWT